MRHFLVASALTVAGLSYAQSVPVVSGHVHAVGSFIDTDRNSDKGDVNFSVPEATVYFEHSLAGVGVFADLPFSASSTGAIVFDFSGTGQAYVHNNSKTGLGWKLGQWDSPFGAEGASAPETVFNTGGAVAASLPAVHRGASASYAIGGVGIEAFVANPTVFLTNATSIGANSDKIESGLNFSAALGDIDFALGGMYGRAYQKDHWATFFSAGFKGESFNSALELDYLNDKDVVANRNGGKFLAALHFNYLPSELLNVGLRTEYLNHDAASVWTATVGPQYQIEKGVFLRADYTLNNTTNDMAVGNPGGAQFLTHTVAVGAVAQF